MPTEPFNPEDFYAAIDQIAEFTPTPSTMLVGFPEYDAYSQDYDQLCNDWRVSYSLTRPTSFATVSTVTSDTTTETPVPATTANPGCFCPRCQEARAPAWRPRTRDGYHLDESHRNRSTGTTIEQFYGRQSYAVYCAAHESAMYVDTVAERRRLAADPKSWCNECAHKQPKVVRKAKPMGMERSFGVEIEYVNLSEEDTMAAFREAGIPLHYDDDEGGWEVKEDGSVSGGRNGWGSEIASPILKGEKGLEQIRKALKVLREHGAEVNDTCGLHVHLDADDLSAKHIGALARTYLNNHDLIDWMVDPDRRVLYEEEEEESYVIRIQEHEVVGLESITNKNMIDVGDRYRSINFDSYSRFGTVEFRQHHGTLSFSEAESWIRFCQALLDAVVKANAPLEVFKGLRSFVTALPLESDTRTFLIGRPFVAGRLFGDATLVKVMQ